MTTGAITRSCTSVNVAPLDERPQQTWSTPSFQENADMAEFPKAKTNLLSHRRQWQTLDVTPPAISVNAEETVYLKYLLSRLLEDSMKIFEEVKDSDYHYWVSDPILMAIIRSCLQKLRYVRGCKISLHPFTMAHLEPKLNAAQAPLRLVCRGDFHNWTISPLEDLREISPAQSIEAIEEENWMITFFGSQEGHQKPPGTPVPSTPSATASSARPVPMTPAPQTPAPMTPVPQMPAPGMPNPSTPAPLLDEPSTSSSTTPGPTDGGDQLVPYEGIDTEVAQLRTIKPLYSVKRVLQRLPEAIKKEPATARRLLLGLHEKLWHAPAADFANLLLRAGTPAEVVEAASSVVAQCSICRRYSRLPSRPQSKTSLAAHFGDEVEVDIFYLFNKTFFLMIDSATRYKVVFELTSRETSEMLRGILLHWIRYFGPMRVLTWVSKGIQKALQPVDLPPSRGLEQDWWNAASP